MICADLKLPQSCRHCEAGYTKYYNNLCYIDTFLEQWKGMSIPQIVKITSELKNDYKKFALITLELFYLVSPEKYTQYELLL